VLSARTTTYLVHFVFRVLGAPSEQQLDHGSTLVSRERVGIMERVAVTLAADKDNGSSKNVD